MSYKELMPKTLYLQLYDSLPEEAKQAMSDLLDIGKDDSGVWVRFRDVEATVGKIVLALRKEKGGLYNEGIYQPGRCTEDFV